MSWQETSFGCVHFVVSSFLPFLYQFTSGLWDAVATHLIFFSNPSLTIFFLMYVCVPGGLGTKKQVLKKKWFKANTIDCKTLTPRLVQIYIKLQLTIRCVVQSNVKRWRKVGAFYWLLNIGVPLTLHNLKPQNNFQLDNDKANLQTTFHSFRESPHLNLTLIKWDLNPSSCFSWDLEGLFISTFKFPGYYTFLSMFCSWHLVCKGKKDS